MTTVAQVQWRKVLRNVLSNWVSYVVTAAIGFLLTPVVVHSLGNTGYGLWTLVLSLTGYFGLLDLGIRSSVGRFVTRYQALHEHENVNRTVSTAVMMLAVGGMLAFLATVVMVTLFFDRFRVEPEYLDTGRIALMITGLNMALILPLSVFSAILIGLERFDVVSGVSMACELVRAALVVGALRMGYGLVTLALITLTLTALQYSTLAVLAKFLYRPLRFRLQSIDRRAFGELFGFGIFRFIWIAANQLIFYSDSIVIGIFLGASSITQFAIGASLINYGRNVVSMLTDTLAPSATRMDAHEDLGGLRKLLIIGTKISLIVALPLCIGFWFLGGQFISLWMGKAYLSSAVFLAILTIPQAGSMSQYTSALILAGMARHRALAYFALAEGLLNLALSVYLVQKIGIIGVAWGTVIPNLLSNSVFVPLYTLSIVKMDAREYLRKALAGPLFCAVPAAAAAYACARLVVGVSWMVFLAEVVAIVIPFAVMAYFVCLDSSQRRLVSVKLGIRFHREEMVHEA